ncbi:aminotransferase class V-fold PLP-dependent enzyme [Arenicella xantha]|uniref:Selenocysteine lyase/cysteine desulfurase n=1 Tax=Arenicella xantha TaxID=644221 RepID=A0A395JKC5_9GAMM|nr:aminotransferase class V-fold PLP-dependent enzyme [Arenicella xantha]RBP51141.1 selenocysteine lyase/cysteine desulfurase [Arenicella xantha]
MSTLLKNIRQSVIGDGILIDTAFGEKPLIYADYTASGRSLEFIENLIRDRVLPYYANTHTETSHTGAVTTKLREQARNEIREALNASSDYSILFCGSGATAAIHKLIEILNLRIPADLNARYQLDQHIPDEQRPVVFIGPYEHHSNELPWRECLVELVVIPLDEQGGIDQAVLAERLSYFQSRRLKIGSFSAASNVTGIISDVDAISSLLHEHDALAFWDYAAAAPYVAIDVQGKETASIDTSKDAVFLSPHKFVGGPGTPGVLVIKNTLLTNRVPAVSGGGTVTYVTPHDHCYTSDFERREEGGTPAIVETMRAGLVFKLQQQVGTDLIKKLESNFIERAIARWQKHGNIKLLGNLSAKRLSIVSFTVSHQQRQLHYGFLVAVLNDLFGIQSRGGCSCAGPYAHHLLDLSMSHSKEIESQLVAGQKILRPGWVRLNFNYFIDETTFNYIVSAVELVADHAWRLLPFYVYDSERGLWNYQGQTRRLPLGFDDLDFNCSDAMITPMQRKVKSAQLTDYLQQASIELRRDRTNETRHQLALPESTEALRWFVLPQEIELTAS